MREPNILSMARPFGFQHTEETKRKLSEKASLRIGNKNPNWHGGRYQSQDGYILVRVGKNYALEHRIVMENYLDRKLNNRELIHHLNGVKDDNRIENLQLVTHSEHSKLDANNTPLPRCEKCNKWVGKTHTCVYGTYGMLGKKHSSETKKLISEKLKLFYKRGDS